MTPYDLIKWQVLRLEAWLEKDGTSIPAVLLQLILMFAWVFVAIANDWHPFDKLTIGPIIGIALAFAARAEYKKRKMKGGK